MSFTLAMSGLDRRGIAAALDAQAAGRMNALDVDIRLRRGAFRLEAQFSAPADGITVLFGPSGSGKSSLLSAIAGLLQRGTDSAGPCCATAPWT